MFGRRALQTNVFAALMLVGAGSAAALLAHVGIDLAGDVLLARDAYDGLDHRSRSDVFAVALTLATGALLRLVWLALSDARAGRITYRPTLDDVLRGGPLRFVCAVVALTLPVLMTMELLDVLGSGRRVDDVTDLLGGSAWLGLGITIPVAAFVAALVRSLTKLVLSSHRALVTVIARLLAFHLPSCPRLGEHTVTPSGDLRIRRRSVLSRRSGKRGPPLHV